MKMATTMAARNPPGGDQRHKILDAVTITQPKEPQSTIPSSVGSSGMWPLAVSHGIKYPLPLSTSAMRKQVPPVGFITCLRISIID